MKFTKILSAFALGIFLCAWFPKLAKASDGTFELRSTTGEDYRCFAASLLIDNFKILVSCRELLYPSGTYVLWATPVDGGNPIKLGALDFGKKLFASGKAFNSLFVSLEENPGVRSPTGTVVMQGRIQPVTFLDRPTTPTPTPREGEIAEGGETAEGEKQPTTREKLLTALKRAGVAALFALVALIGLIFVITRSRR